MNDDADSVDDDRSVLDNAEGVVNDGGDFADDGGSVLDNAEGVAKNGDDFVENGECVLENAEGVVDDGEDFVDDGPPFAHGPATGAKTPQKVVWVRLLRIDDEIDRPEV